MIIRFKRLYEILLSSALVVILLGVANAASLKLTALPAAATANSLWTFDAVWNDDNPDKVILPAGKGDATPTGFGLVYLCFPGDVKYPMFYAYSVGDEQHYQVSVSAGLNMSNPAQNPATYVTGNAADSNSWIPSTNQQCLVWDPYGHPVLYAPELRTETGAPRAIGGIIALAYSPEEVKSSAVSVTVYDSKNPMRDSVGNIVNFDYAGVSGDRDWLTCAPDQAWPADVDVDPLTIEPGADANQTSPDDGSGNQQFVFRVRYHNRDHLPPLPWVKSELVDQSGSTDKEVPMSGVVLYLDASGIGDYQLFPMYPENPDAAALDPDKQVYIVRLLPAHQFGVSGTYTNSSYLFPGFECRNSAYESLALGTHKYFFGCSDDSLQFLGYNGSPKPFVFSCFPDPTFAQQWGVYPSYIGSRNNTALDPILSRAVTDYPDIKRDAHRRYTTANSNIDPFADPVFDYTIHLDRAVKAPGYADASATPYPWKSSEHPKVTCALTMPTSDLSGVRYDDMQKYGGGRFYGTILPFKRAVNPQLPGAFSNGFDAVRAEFAGSTASTENTFQIVFKQVDGKAPEYIRLWINKASSKSGNTSASTYTPYTMSIDPADQIKNYTTGVKYIYKLKLDKGPHTYYFEASDGIQRTIWPKRPDHYTYNGETFSDWWVPTMSTTDQYGQTVYDDNDYVPGPYVNDPCVLSDYSLGNTSGEQGTGFEYKVRYTDPDGQRPYAAYLYIRKKDNPGSVKQFRMLPDGLLNPLNNNSTVYKNGIYYKFTVASSDLSTMEPGIWEYRFEFVDDWGRQTDPNDLVAGETTKLPVTGGWFTGPTITENKPPTLTNGGFDSADGSSNSATIWTFHVTYSDSDSAKEGPTVMKVYIGQLQPDSKLNDLDYPDGKTILWDKGHDMVKDNSGDSVYSDGVAYHYQTRLEGKESEHEYSKQYYYAFVAFDGVNWAEYRPANDPTAPSPSASVVRNQDMTKLDDINYKIEVPITGAPIVGPISNELPAPAGTIYDAQVINAGVNPNELFRLDDVKGGWQDATVDPADSRYSVMRGHAIANTDPLSDECVVVPEYPSLIASVEGVYTSIGALRNDTSNLDSSNLYVEPGRNGTNEWQYGWVDTSDQTRKTVIPDYPSRIRDVDAVYNIYGDDTTTNLYVGPGNFGPTDNKVHLNIAAANGDESGYNRVLISYFRSGYNCGDSSIWLTQVGDNIEGSTVYIKYSDIRFTHQGRGVPSFIDPDPLTAFLPTQYPLRFYVKGTDGDNDPLNGVLGVWQSAEREGTNYYDPRRTSYPDNLGDGSLKLTSAIPSADISTQLWANYYQLGDYNIDRLNAKVRFINPVSASKLKATYIFGTKMQVKIGGNTPPTLELVDVRKDAVSPIQGSRTTQYVYTIKYRDQDGPNGQAPTYVRVKIDDQQYDMTLTTQGTPAYRDGAIYTYSTTALSSGKHTYHFEASDGTAVAIFDVYTKNNPKYDHSDGDIRDFDGPWVNNPPKLADGAASPNPSGGSISANASVTYSVTYSDADGDMPYVYKIGDVASGVAVSGSPRVWVDCNGNTDHFYNGKVSEAPLPDPLESNKFRLLRATFTDEKGAAATITRDQFAGKLMQITSGPLINRVYLIQSNSTDTLTIAADDLGVNGDNVVKDTTFRINGLLMRSSGNGTAVAGITYTLIIPKLAVGDHKYLFTARSGYQDKPAWLIDSLPYSDKVIYPTGNEGVGPKVTSAPPSDNKAPVISNTAQTSLYYGPKMKMATVVDSTQVELNYDSNGNWTAPEVQNIRQVNGVFLNANANTALDQNYYDTAHVFDPTVGNVISLSPALGAMPATMVQFGTVGNIGSSLLSVTPDAIDSIDSIVGVYVASTCAVTDTNYYLGGPALQDNDTKITLTTPLPSGTKRVYIKYVPKSGVQPPVYVNYFDKHSTSTIFLAGDTLTFRINYKDADNDPPSYHDGVQGYVKLVFDNQTSGIPMDPVTTPVTDYTQDVLLKVKQTSLPEGNHYYHFEASDGYDPDHKVRFPATSAGDYSLKVNYKPTLTSQTMQPFSGQTATTFKFTVTYRDYDGSVTNAPTPQVYVRLIRAGATPAEIIIKMTPKDANPVYATGAVFNAEKTGLAPGSYTVAFEAYDGYQYADPLYEDNLVVRDHNAAPTITSYTVDPAAGKTTQLFTYKATYVDADGDAPVAMSGTSRVEGLTLVIDSGTTAQQRLVMTRSVSGTTPNYAAGVEYKVTVPGTSFTIGKHNYTVEATDGTDAAATPSLKLGPVLLVPFFDDIKLVKADESNPSAAMGLSYAAVGTNVLLEGKIKFPKNALTSKPSNVMLENIVVQVTKPDSTSLSLTASVTMLTDDEFMDPDYWIGNVQIPSYPKGSDAALITGENLTLSTSGEWRLGLLWAGDSIWDKAQTDESYDGLNDGVRITVGGPMRTVAVKDPSQPNNATANLPCVDMITPPMVINGTDPSSIFGYERASKMQIVRWDPRGRAYFRYGLQAFPVILPGDAVWIKPKTDYPAESVSEVDYITGLLAAGNSTYPLEFDRTYRLIKAYSKAYSTQVNSVTGQTELAPCVIPVYTGWNQFGNIFFNWRKNSTGATVVPYEDAGIPFSEVKVRYLNVEKSLADASAAGWIRDYAWRFDADQQQYVLVSATRAGAERVLKSWSGYWIKTFVDCELIINPNTTYKGLTSLTSRAKLAAPAANAEELDAPPAIP
ncbi:MAG: hypothetical protein ABFD54_11880 [Armatimonadota bacterium]|nr:hypothetical protein [bacterium]